MRRHLSVLLPIVLVGALLAAGSPGVASSHRTYAPTPPTTTSGASGSSPTTGALAAVAPAGDEGIDPTAVRLTPGDGGIQLYPDLPSVLPGQTLRLHTSTTARSYAITITREGWPQRVVFVHSGYAGHDYRSRVRTDPTTNTTRANWPVSIAISTKGWRTGVYTVYAKDSSGRSSGAIFVVRDATPSRAKALFVLPVMDYQAYNGWGGSSFYTAIGRRAIVVSWDRPFNTNGGLSSFPAYDRYTLRWLERHGYPLAYTTDYDLAVAPPAVAPRVLVLAQHTEYVTKSLFDWVDQHVNVAGDMNVAYLGANSFYWQVRLVRDPRGGSRPFEMLSYKSSTADPITATNPELTTTRWRSAPVNRPEAGLFGAQYDGMVEGGPVRFDMTVQASMPAWALAGTGWRVGTVIRGILVGEADATLPGYGGIVGLEGHAPYRTRGRTSPLLGQSSFRQSASGGRVFDAGTFGWGAALGGRWPLGVSQASFDRFSRNVMAWVGLAATR